ncbi:geminin coiled-coil domain-containing protein 1 [Antennarius striatus]|uniref:geminin coiled-coil domain-containing protein 1 n=1 Tax=Antennarius striatus TaxID=241820 RepID=UPI0035B4F6BA
METLASVWACDPCDLSDLGLNPSTTWESQCNFSSTPPASLMWTKQLSPHLQRNKQLQDTLLQREEELARLQEENNKLRGFLNSSFVRKLGDEAKKLPADGRRKLKRSLMLNEPFQISGQQHRTSQPVSKRVCRNLAAEFCFETTETSSTEPNLDLWVLRTLGLKDRDTIDTSSGSSCSSLRYRRSSHVNGAESSPDSSFSSSLTSSTPSSVHNSPQTDFTISASEFYEQNCCTSPGQYSDFIVTGRQCEAPEALIRSYNTPKVFQSPPQTEQTRADICSVTASDQIQTQPVYWSPTSQAPSLNKIQFSPPGERTIFCPTVSLSPVMNQLTSISSPSVGSMPTAVPQSTSIRTDLAFSMSLSPSSSVKTHSFPHGQAFVRKDPEGKWNFTWLPRQEP